MYSHRHVFEAVYKKDLYNLTEKKPPPCILFYTVLETVSITGARDCHETVPSIFPVIVKLNPERCFLVREIMEHIFQKQFL